MCVCLVRYSMVWSVVGGKIGCYPRGQGKRLSKKGGFGVCGLGIYISLYCPMTSSGGIVPPIEDGIIHGKLICLVNSIHL